MLKNRIFYLVILIILVLFRIAYTGYVAGMLLLIAFIMPIFSWVLSLPGAIYTRVSISIPDQVIRGSEAKVSLAIRQSRLFSTGPISGKLKCTNVVTGTVQHKRMKSAKHTFTLDTSHCCRYELSFRGVRIYDLLGLIPMPVRKSSTVYTSVLPFPVEPPDHPAWIDSSDLVSKTFSDASLPYELRDYRIGDSMRAIHWKKSAALDKTVVRDTLEPSERIASIWLDWPEDAAGRDLALDQLSWCLIYLNQNNAGLLLHWLDRDGSEQTVYAPQGHVDSVIPHMLTQRAGKRCVGTVLRINEILLSAGNGEVRA